MHIFLLAAQLVCLVHGGSPDLPYLASIFPGNYDNILQHQSDVQHHVPPTSNLFHERLSMAVTPQDIPILSPGRTFYLEEYVNGNTSALVRQRIYCFTQQGESDIRLQLYELKNPAKFAHSRAYSPLFANLTEDDVIYIEGCDVFWARIEETLFRSHMFNTCVVNYHGTEVTITDTNDLSPTYLTVKETWTVTNNGTVIRSTPVPYKLMKQGRHAKIPFFANSYLEKGFHRVGKTWRYTER